MTKLDYILEHCNFSNLMLGESGFLCDNSKIVGTLVAKAVKGATKEEAAKKMVIYLDEQVENQDAIGSLIKNKLLLIGWSAASEHELTLSKEHLARAITKEEFRAFNFISNHDALKYAFTNYFKALREEVLIEKAKILGIETDSYSDFISKLEDSMIESSLWEELGNSRNELREQYIDYYMNTKSIDDLKLILDKPRLF